MKRHTESTDHAADNREAGDRLRVHAATLVGREPGIVIVNGKHLQFLTIGQGLRLATKIADQIETINQIENAKAKAEPKTEPTTGEDRPPLILSTRTEGDQ